jgi:DNA-directed RNA polymerase subunit RPC12/RpoP
MSRIPACPACSSERIYKYKKAIAAGGGYAPQLLPGTSAMSAGKFTPVVCASCGLVRFFADERTVERIEHSKHWSRV